jgi:hypothetical protein
MGGDKRWKGGKVNVSFALSISVILDVFSLYLLFLYSFFPYTIWVSGCYFLNFNLLLINNKITHKGVFLQDKESLMSG